MIKNTIYSLFLVCIISTNSYCQLPIGKDFQKGKQELKLLMQKNGFHFLKEQPLYGYNSKTDKWDLPLPNQINLLFKEEITISVEANEYENIKSILICADNVDYYNTLLKMCEFSEWKFLYSKEGTVSGKDEFYRINNYYAMINNTHSIKQIFFMKDL